MFVLSVIHRIMDDQLVRQTRKEGKVRMSRLTRILLSLKKNSLKKKTKPRMKMRFGISFAHTALYNLSKIVAFFILIGKMSFSDTNPSPINSAYAVSVCALS